MQIQMPKNVIKYKYKYNRTAWPNVKASASRTKFSKTKLQRLTFYLQVLSNKSKLHNWKTRLKSFVYFR